ncbi:Retrovirus-related Pol polyprotein from transposon RE1 [Vitis vinifera]|uniref:Retrovirus-related Pol polyprotein from transposon RE1 n=1 Tax=Vitis vinifera TaxID=29760 RepID=A0A438I2R5_VITVI|nr:Retrovirus-related Pol polyprotein from transposon RE1 [Vitis vinifera]
MQAIKTRVDELALLGKPIDDEDLIDRVLEGLSDEYKSVIDAINGRDMSISFAKLHKKLLNKEASLQTTQPLPLSLLATTNPTTFRNSPNWHPLATTPQQLGLTTVFSLHDQCQPKLIWVIVKHAVFKDTLPSDARCFGLSLINNLRHLVLKALMDYFFIRQIHFLFMPSQMQIVQATKTIIPLQVPKLNQLDLFPSHRAWRHFTYTSPIIYCDNVGATYLYSNPVFHSRMKHVAIDYHFIRDQVQSGALGVTHISSADQLVDALTKPLPRSRFQELRVKTGVSLGAPS